MKSIKEFFEKKKLAHKFSKAGPGAKLADEANSSKSGGHRLGSSDSGPSKIGSTSSTGSLPSSSSDKLNPAKIAAAEAAERRIQALKLQNQKATVKMSSYKSYPTSEEHPSSESLPKDTIPKKPEEDVQPVNEDDYHTFNCPSLEINEYYPLPELKERIEAKIKFDFTEEPVIMGSLLIRNCNPKDKAEACVSTLEVILNNLKTEDSDKWEKFRKIRKAKIEQKILSVKGGIEFLTGSGFILDQEGEWFVYDGPRESVADKVDYHLDILKSSDICPIMLNRQTRTVNLNDYATPNIEFDDKVFEMTKDELSREQQSRKEIAEREMTLMTRAMRERYINKKPISKYTRLRYKTLDMKMVETTFKTNETLHDFIGWLKTNYSIDDIENYDIACGTEIIQVENWSKTFLELDLYPKATLYQRSKAF